MKHRSRTAISRSVAVACVAGLLALPFGGIAEGHPVEKFWRYGKDVRKHRWWGHETKKRRHERWHRWHSDADARAHRRYHHRRLTHRHRRNHLHRVARYQEGDASWYDMAGATGACGVPLKGLYAAHPTWPCGAKVSVRRGSKYVIVRVRDRGPYTAGRVIDISKEAFARLGDPGAGIMGVKIYRLKKA